MLCADCGNFCKRVAACSVHVYVKLRWAYVLVSETNNMSTK